MEGEGTGVRMTCRKRNEGGVRAGQGNARGECGLTREIIIRLWLMVHIIEGSRVYNPISALLHHFTPISSLPHTHTSIHQSHITSYLPLILLESLHNLKCNFRLLTSHTHTHMGYQVRYNHFLLRIEMRW